MSRQDDLSDSGARLRLLADEKKRSVDADVSDNLTMLSTDEIRKLLHDLHTHQIELEMQNEELRQAQLALEAARQRYFDLYELAPIGYCTLSENNLILEINLTGATLLKSHRNALIKRPLTDFILPEDNDAYYLHHKALLASGKAQVCELRMVKSGGEVFWVRLEATVEKAEESAQHCRIVMSDISVSKQDEETLRESDRRFSATFEQAAVGIAQVALDGSWIKVNRRLCDIVGYSQKELLKKTFQDITYHDDIDEEIAYLKEMLEGKSHTYSIEKRYIRKSGTLVWINLTASLVRKDSGEPDYFIAVIEDISKRKMTEVALLESEEIFNHFMENSPIYVFFKDHNLRPVKLSSNFEQLLGRPVQEMLGKTMDELFPSDLAKKIIADDKKILEEGKVVVTNETLNSRYYTTIKFPIVINGKPCFLAGYTIDITERKLAESNRELLTKAIEQSGETIVVTDPKGNIEYVNLTFEKETGYTRDEVIGNNIRIMKSGKQDDTFYQHLWSTISRGEPFHGRMVNKRKDGSLFTEDATISPVCDTAGNILNFLAVKRNVTEHIQLEANYQQAQKMESIGRLAGGVAHDYNNMLSVIIGYAELVMGQVDPTDPLHDDLTEIFNAAKRSARITRQLLAFARKQPIVTRKLDFNTSVEEMLKMLRHLVGEDIELYWKPTPKLLHVKMDLSQLDQILANLCVNARDAISGNGQITIETKRATLDADYCTVHAGFTPGDFVQLTVSDNGCGMDRETLDHAFEPFFTTKGIGKGTGLGLATVYGIVKQNNGFINIYSEPDKGTTFNIYLPPHVSQANLAKAADQAAIPRGHGETILVVEDEIAILRFLRKALDGIGYTVMSASLPSEAIRLAESHPNTIDILLTDVIMPELNGLELAERIQTSHPETKALFMSGYADNVIFKHGLQEKGVGFIQKPLSRMELATKIRAALEQKRISP